MMGPGKDNGASELPLTPLLRNGDSGGGPPRVRPDGPVILLLCSATEREWAADTAAGLAESWAEEGRRVVLADLHLEEPLLHAGGDGENLEGVVDVFLYGASVSRIVQPVAGRDFLLIPAGTYSPEAGQIYGHPLWRKVISGFREDDAALALFVPAERGDLRALGQWASQAILLGPPPSETYLQYVRDSGLELLAVVQPPNGNGTGQPPEIGTEPPRRPRPARKRSVVPAALPRKGFPPLKRAIQTGLDLPVSAGRPRSRRDRATVLLWIFFGLMLLATIGYLMATLRPDAIPGVEPIEPPPNVVSGVELAAPDQLGELLSYSVHVRAFTSLEAAYADVISSVQESQAPPFFISPEEIQGVLYYRIFAGIAADTTAAGELRDWLVESGSVDADDSVGEWSLLQFTPLAFDLGEFPTAEAMVARADSLLAQRIPTYAVKVPYTDGTARWQLYGGAYGDNTAASAMRDLLARAGLPIRLTSRTGLSHTLPE
ncbi:MAG: hypothetical protein GEU90_07405 [Gemmatimonas sp.]|nr:hypothetical protein [Gemmatimonas sp.]